jgi:hypothetical protein
MTYQEYSDLFQIILDQPTHSAPYDDPDFLNYLKLNQSRHHRWMKKGELSPDTVRFIKSIDTEQHWLLISEPWCGDAAHSTPFIHMMAELNPKITLEVQLRDSDSEIENYLTNGGKSIPILVVRNNTNEDLFVWGPRPEAAQTIHLANLKSEKTKEEKKIELQNWYNQDKAEAIQNEIIGLREANKKNQSVLL